MMQVSAAVRLYSQASRPRAQQEHEAVRVRLAEAVDGRLPHVPPDAPVDPLVEVPAARTRERTMLDNNHTI